RQVSGGIERGQNGAADGQAVVAQAGRARNEDWSGAAGAHIAEVVNFESCFAGDVEEAAVEGHADFCFTSRKRADEILARDLHVAEVGDGVGRQRLSAQGKYLRSET